MWPPRRALAFARRLPRGSSKPARPGRSSIITSSCPFVYVRPRKVRRGSPLLPPVRHRVRHCHPSSSRRPYHIDEVNVGFNNARGCLLIRRPTKAAKVVVRVSVVRPGNRECPRFARSLAWRPVRVARTFCPTSAGRRLPFIVRPRIPGGGGGPPVARGGPRNRPPSGLPEKGSDGTRRGGPGPPLHHPGSQIITATAVRRFSRSW